MGFRGVLGLSGFADSLSSSAGLPEWADWYLVKLWGFASEIRDSVPCLAEESEQAYISQLVAQCYKAQGLLFYLFFGSQSISRLLAVLLVGYRLGGLATFRAWALLRVQGCTAATYEHFWPQ